MALAATEAAPTAGGFFIIDDTQEGILLVQDLPPLNAEHQYQLWLIDPRDTRTSGGVFSVGSDGSAVLTMHTPAPLASYAALGITVEPYGGSPGPTGAMVLGGDL